MGFFIAMFVCNLLMPLMMLIGGYCMYKKLGSIVSVEKALKRTFDENGVRR